MIYIESPSTDPKFNMALEQYAFDSLDNGQGILMLWQNNNAIIVGKYQNVAAEINLDYAHEHNINIVRRLSGGGAVYHDLGNLNYTIIMKAYNEEIDFSTFCQPVIETLKEFGVNAEVTGRNDITIGGKKFSGSAQYIKNGRVMHHGTLMFKSNLDVLESALKVDESKIVAKGIKSVRSRVTNISDYLSKEVSLESFKAALLSNFANKNIISTKVLNQKDFDNIDNISKNRYSTWDWNYGRSPEFTVRKVKRYEGCGSVEAFISADRGIINSIQFFGDFFSLDEPRTVEELLRGKRMEYKDIELALNDIDVSRCFKGLKKEQLIRLIVN